MRTILLCLGLCLAAAAPAFGQAAQSWRESMPEERQLDATAFQGFDRRIEEDFGDVESVVVVLQGRTVYQYYRDGNPDMLRDTQSVTKSALTLLVGALMQSGELVSLDRPVVERMPQWLPLNGDSRARSITLGHLLAMTPGFEASDEAGTAAPLPPSVAWARPLRAAPGVRFSYDNSNPVMVAAVLEGVTGRPLADLVLTHLVEPLAMKAPTYRHGSAYLRTVDMAKLGQLLLQEGRWNDRPLLPAAFAAQLTQRASPGGPPVGMPYGLGWWTTLSGSTFFASGYAGQMVMVHPALQLVIAMTSTVSAQSQQRGQASRLSREGLFQAAQKRSTLSAGRVSP